MGLITLDLKTDCLKLNYRKIDSCQLKVYLKMIGIRFQCLGDHERAKIWASDTNVDHIGYLLACISVDNIFDEHMDVYSLEFLEHILWLYKLN